MHRPQAHPEVLRNGRGRPALMVEGPDLRMQGLPAGLTLRRALLYGPWDVLGWHRHRHRLIGQRHGLRAQRGIDGIEDLLMREEHLVQGFTEILEQMKAVRNLGRSGCSVPCALGIGARAVPGNHLDPRMGLEPLRHGIGRALREEGHGLATLQIHQDRAIGMPFAQGKIVHPEHPGRGEDRPRQPAQHAQEGVAAYHQVPRVAEAHPSLPTQRHAEGDQALGEPQRASGPGSGDGGHPFGEDMPRAAAMTTKPLADAELEAHTILRPGQIGQDASIATVDAARRCGTGRTGHAGLRRRHEQSELCCRVIDRPRLEAQRGGIG